MKITSDAMTVLVGLLNDLCTMQRKVEAGQGATCGVFCTEGPDGEISVTFQASIDPGFTIKPAEHFPGEALLRQQPVSHVLPPEGTPIRNGRSTYPFAGSVDERIPHFPGRDPRNLDVAHD